MKKLKRVIKISACVAVVLILCKYGLIFLLNHGYIPLTDEYEWRIRKNLYNQNEEAFELLMDEIDELNTVIPQALYDSTDRVLFIYRNLEWYIIIKDDMCERHEQIMSAKNTDSIKQIENAFEETFKCIVYIKANKEYAFRIGERYYICISDEGITVQ